MLIACPLWFWMLLLVPMVGVIDWYRRGARRLATALIRMACLTAAILALAHPLIGWHVSNSKSITVLDLSTPSSDSRIAGILGQMTASTQGVSPLLVVYGTRSTVVTDPQSLKDPQRLAALRHRVELPLWSDDLPEHGANLADALRLAGTLIAPDERGSIRLISTGRSDHGDAVAEAWRLAQRGIGVATEPIAPEPLKTIRVKRVSVLSAARLGQTVRADVTVESTAAGIGNVRLVTSGGEQVNVAGNLVPGDNHLSALLNMDAVGLMVVRAQAWVDTGDAPNAENLQAAIYVAEPTNVLLVQDSEGASPLAPTLLALLQSSATIHPVSADALGERDIDIADALILADVPADHLSSPVQQHIRSAVGQGMGLVLSGAAKSFGPGGYDDSALARILPVTMPQEMQSIDPSTTLVLIIDTSASMTGLRIDLAKEVSRLALTHLKPYDKAGIVEFYGGKRWAAPIQSAGNISVLHRALDRLTAGGGTTLYPAVEEAAFSLRNVHTRSKHVLICSDGFVEDAPFERLVRQMADDGIVVSTVQVAAPDGQANQMPDIARWGNGRYYTVLDPYGLPEISFKEPQLSLTSPLVHTASRVETGDDPLLAGTSSSDLGLVAGYVRTRAKATADVLLKTADGSPLLTRWRWGAGFVATIPTQLGSIMADGLENKPRFARLFADLVRQIGSGRGSPSQITTRARPLGVEVDVTASTANAGEETDDMEFMLEDAAGKIVRSMSAAAIGPGHWNVVFPDVPAGAYVVRTSLADGASGKGAIAVPAPAVALLTDNALLDRISGFGSIANQQATLLSDEHRIYFDARPWLASAAAVLLLMHVALRRWPRSVKRPNAPSAPVISRPARAAVPVTSTALLFLFVLLCAGSRCFADAMPATQPVDWNQRVEQALTNTGSVDSVAAALTAVPRDQSAGQSAVDRAKVRIAIEQGDLESAVANLRNSLQHDPANHNLLHQLAQIQELTGDDAAAEQCWIAASGSATAAPDAAPAVDAILRLAILNLDEEPAGPAGVDLLRRAATVDPSAACRAGLIAYLYGNYAQAAECLKAGVGDPTTAVDVGLLLLEGNAALQAGRNDISQPAFKRAFEVAVKPADRLYAQERLVAAARAAGTLPQLADAWSSDKNLAPELMLPLATVLNELGRSSQLLEWWKSASTDTSLAEIVLSERFVQEVKDAADSSGHADDAIAVCRHLLALHPDDWQWLGATVEVLMTNGRAIEADALLDNRAAALADAPAELERLARLARSFGRDEPALRAARLLAKFGGGTAIDGLLLQAAILRRAGDTGAAEQLLGRARDLAISHPIAVIPVTGSLEEAGMDKPAIELLQKCIAQDPSENLLNRLASLLLKDHRSVEAIPVLSELMQRGSSEASRQQAGQRLLDAEAAAGGLDQLIKQLHEKIDGSENNSVDIKQDVSLLISADLRAGAVNDAANVLRNDKTLDEPTRLQQLAVLYLRTKNFDAAADSLRQLVNAQPEEAIQTLERLADTDLKRGQPAAAMRVIEQITQRIGRGPDSAEMMAGVLDRLGHPAEAAVHYRRALAVNPRNGDDWLLWSTAMSKSGNNKTAMHRLQVLCSETPDDTVFATAVDGLLNMSAPAQVLRATRRDALMRVTARPRSMILYQVMADLCEELGDDLSQKQAIEACVPFSVEERPERLRELMSVACSHHEVETAVDCGRSLLALGDEFPPELFLQLGEQLLIAGKRAEATRAFSRAGHSADPQQIGMRTADLYRQYGYPRAALNTLQQLWDRDRYDADYRQIVGGLNETLGRSDAAFDDYLAGISIMISQVAGDKSAIAMRSMPMSMMDRGSSPASRVHQFVNGAMATARTPAQRTTLLHTLRDGLDLAIADPENKSAPGNGPTALAGELRRVALGFACPEIAGSADSAVIKRWPAASAFERAAFADRMQNGFVLEAGAFAIAHGIDPGPMVETADGRLDQAPAGSTWPAATTIENAPPVTMSQAAQLLPGLIARGHTDAAKALLARVFFDGGEPPSTSIRAQTPSALTLIRAAAVLGDHEDVTRWTLAWMSASPTQTDRDSAEHHIQLAQDPDVIAAGSYRILSSVLPLLNLQGQIKAVDLLARQVDAMTNRSNRGLNRAFLSSFVLRLAAALPDPPQSVIRTIEPVLSQGTERPNAYGAVSNVVIMRPLGHRAEALKQVLTRIPPKNRLSLLTSLVSAAPVQTDDALSKAVIDAAEQIPPGQDLGWTDWFCNAWQKSTVLTLADVSNRTAQESNRANVAALALAAAGFSVGGDQARADQAAVRVIQAMQTSSDSNRDPAVVLYGNQALPDHVTLLRIAAGAMSAKARLAFLDSLNSSDKPTANSKSDRVWTHMLRLVFLEAVGRRDESLTEVRMAYRADPTDRAVERAYLQRLNEDGRWAELIEQFTRQASGSDYIAYQLRLIVTPAMQNLYRWREFQSLPADFGTTLETSIDLAEASATNNVSDLTAAMQLRLQSMREPRRLATIPQMPARGGLDGVRQLAATPAPPFDRAGDWPDAPQDLLAALRILNSGSGGMPSNVGSWAAGVLANAARTPTVLEQILNTLGPAVTAHALTPGQRELIACLAIQPGITVPSGWLDELWPAALADQRGDELERLGTALAAQHQTGSEGAIQWARVCQGDSGRGREAQRERPLSGPMDLVEDDGALAESLAAECDQNPTEAEQQAGLFLTNGRASLRFVNTAAVWARGAAERGDLSAFKIRLQKLLSVWAWERINPTPGSPNLLNPAQKTRLWLAVPSHVSDAYRHSAMVDVMAPLLASLAEAWPSNTDITRQLALLGDWANRHGDAAAAEAFLKKAQSLGQAQGAGEHLVWVSDLARELHHEDLARKIDRQLLEHRCLPSDRIISELRELEAVGEVDAARRLRADAASYCREPNLLQNNAALDAK